MIIDTINNTDISCTVENGNLSNKEDIKALALTLSDIVDAYLSCTTQKDLNLNEVGRFISTFDLHEVKNRIVNTYEKESNSEKNIDNVIFVTNVEDNTQKIEFDIKTFSQLETVIILLYLAAWLYRKTGDHKNHSFQLVKVLHLLKHYFDTNPDYIKKINKNDYSEIIKKLFVDKAISGFYCAHDHVHNYETEEFKDIFDSNYNNLLHEHISLNRISINSDLNEGLFVFYQIKLMLTDEIRDKEWMDLYSLCNPYTLNTNMYNRIIKLEYRLALNSRLFKEQEIEERKSSRDIESHFAIFRKFKELILNHNSQKYFKCYNYELIEFLISDSIFCCFEILKLCKIFGLSYGINYSIIAKAHEELWKWSEYLNYYIYLYEVFQKNVELKEKNEIKKEIQKSIINKLNLHSAINDKIIDDFILSKEEIKVLNEIVFFKEYTIMKKIGALIENDNIPFITPLYQCEKAIRAYYSVVETHSEGEAYKNFIENMYFLNDDFNDKYYHFHAALERLAIHLGHVKKRISVLKERMKNSVTYNSDNYLKTKLNNKVDILTKNNKPMSKEQFDFKKAVLEAIPEKEVKDPDIPVDVALQEAEDLYVWCQADKDLLIKAGLKWALVDDLPVRTGACRYVQSQWQKDFPSQEEVQKEWAEKSPAAHDLRDELVHHFYHAFYGANDLYARTQKIAEGSGHADMIQDLSDLAVLGKANTSYLTGISMDLDLLDKAESYSVEMSSLLAKVNGKRMEDNTLRLLRDKAYMHLKEAVDEIRRCGQYVFWRDEQRKKGYVSKYGKAKRQNKPKNGENTEETKK